jgi:tRNA (cmo5U34)-methyltransferase
MTSTSTASLSTSTIAKETWAATTEKQMTDYRWNELDNARGYDRAAEHVHPCYREIQDAILDRLLLNDVGTAWIVDLGGGSGRLAERILDRWPAARVCVIDQSPPFLTLASERLHRFGERARCLQARLQSDWAGELPERPQAIVSMSAIHHLDASEKRTLYAQCARCLTSGGVLMNGDEVRPPQDDDYLAECRQWAQHMQRVMDEGRIPAGLHDALLGWIARNVDRFSEPRTSGDDCHETAEAQLGYFVAAGLQDTGVVWHRDLWKVLYARKP